MDDLSAASGYKWGNFYDTLQKKLLAVIPKAYLTVWRQKPPVDDLRLLTAFSMEVRAPTRAPKP